VRAARAASWLPQEERFPACKQGSCSIASCLSGYVDLNQDISDGCEFQCTPTGVEVCDGLDNDCNGKTDDGVTLFPEHLQGPGPCKGAQAVCKAPRAGSAPTT